MTLPLILAAIGITYAVTVRYCSQPYDEYIELSAKYADAASMLTSMRAKIDDLTEKLDFSDDVRNMLGIENAKLAERIAELETEAEKGCELRLKLIEMLCDSQHAKGAAEYRLEIARRSLRIARHKEFKRWKKLMIRSPRERREPSPASFHYGIRTARMSMMNGEKDWLYRSLIRIHIAKIQSMPPYPLP